METKQFDTYDLLCEKITAEICTAISVNPEFLLCIAAGFSSLGVFEGLVKAFKNKTVDFSRASFVAMDEWIGMDDKTPGSCGELLRKKLLDHVNFKEENIRLFNGKTENPEKECKEVEIFISSQTGAIDFLILGSGMNGHIALNEPGTPFTARAHVANIDSVTREIGQKYFSVKTELQGGLTLGIDNFKQAKRTILMICGEHKKEILKQVLLKAPSVTLPATAIKTFGNTSLYYDAAAGQGV
jgi:glucosamine-6-phosphate isomerase